MPMPVHASTYFACCAAFTALLAALFDLRTGRIPNRLTLPPLAAAPLVHALLSGPGALGGSLLGAVVCAATPALLFARGGMGGGDVKLFAALGGLLGWQLGLEIQLASLWIAMLCVCVQLTWNGELCAALWHVLVRARQALRRSAASATPAPAALGASFRLGAAIGFATLGVLVLERWR